MVYIDNKWAEISCGVCGANASYDRNLNQLKFFGGIIGLNNHIISHRVKDSAKPDIDVVLKCVEMRELSKEDVEAILADHNPKTKITMRILGPTNSAMIDKYLNIIPDVQEANGPDEAYVAEDELKTKKRAATTSPSGDRAQKAPQSRGLSTAGCDQDDEENLPPRKRLRRS